MEIDLAKHATPDWPLADVRRLVELHAEGLSFAAISRMMGGAKGHTKNGVLSKARRMGLERPPTPTKGVAKPRAGQPRPAGPKAAQEPESRPPAPFARASACQWPIGTPRRPGFRFCCSPDVPIGKPYCAEHAKIAYLPSREPRAVQAA